VESTELYVGTEGLEGYFRHAVRTDNLKSQKVAVPFLEEWMTKKHKWSEACYYGQ
jgi:hypothetical protein